jgi:hypothetical protein
VDRLLSHDRLRCQAKKVPRINLLFQPADYALGDVAYGVNRADHLLFAYNDIVKQAFQLRRHAWID